MTYTIVWTPEAFSAIRRLRAADPDGAKLVGAAVTGLATDPCPPGTRALGTSGIYRLAFGDYRVVYEVDGETVTVYVMNVGSVPPPRG
ncbi:MAG TPA: type II toxin-antitoxin system RelE/ParE family toxin [Mycobacteriales bacterium]|nr:type II toxin-antitoxin system RelE/ParE family toxin [Mycobacteriales bacterium]